jgi:hypothetical protein
MLLSSPEVIQHRRVGRFVEVEGIRGEPVVDYIKALYENSPEGKEENTITISKINVSPGIRRCTAIICSELTLVYSIKYLLTYLLTYSLTLWSFKNLGFLYGR